VPNAEEREELEKVSRLKKIHFILLVVFIGIASLTFLFPDDISPLAILALGITIIFVGLSSMRLQHFQRCPRCTGRRTKGQSACSECGLEYYVADTGKEAKG